MAQQFIMGQGSIDLTVKSEKKQYGYELEFEINNLDSDNHNTSLTDIDRIGAAWINDNIGGCTLVNPIDTESIQALHAVNAKIWYMSLSGKDGNCEPTLINLAKELFLAMAALFESHGNSRS